MSRPSSRSAGGSVEARPAKASVLSIAHHLNMTACGPAQCPFLRAFSHVAPHPPTLATPRALAFEHLQLSLEDVPEHPRGLNARRKLVFGQLARPLRVLGEGVDRVKHLEGIGRGPDGNKDEQRTKVGEKMRLGFERRQGGEECTSNRVYEKERRV